jgi:hypothetical protein
MGRRNLISLHEITLNKILHLKILLHKISPLKISLHKISLHKKVPLVSAPPYDTTNIFQRLETYYQNQKKS